MPDSMILTRGLAIPDPNFLQPMGDAWSYGSGFSASSFSAVATSEGCGRALKIDVTGADGTSDYAITSAFTPYGVCGAPWSDDSSDRKPYVVYCIRAKTSGMAGNTAEILKAQLNQYRANGSFIVKTCKTDTGDGPTDETDWTLFTAVETGTEFNTQAYWHKLQLTFTDSDGGGGYVYISFVGVGILYGVEALTYDQIDNTYSPKIVKLTSAKTRWITPQNTLNPIIRTDNMGARSETITLAFPALSTAEKQIIERAEIWNTSQPDDDVSATASMPANRGTKQPVLVALRRAEAKSAFYADMSIGGFAQSMDWYPDSGSRWAAQVTFTERLL